MKKLEDMNISELKDRKDVLINWSISYQKYLSLCCSRKSEAASVLNIPLCDKLNGVKYKYEKAYESCQYEVSLIESRLRILKKSSTYGYLGY
jgi:hypothetical protein